MEESIINWDKLREVAPIEVGKCLAYFTGIQREDTRDCLMACLRRLADPGVALEFETQFKRMETLWESLSPDECLYDFRQDYTWLTSIYIAHRRRNRRALATHEELSVKTRELIQQHTEFMEIAEEVPVYKIDANYPREGRPVAHRCRPSGGIGGRAHPRTDRTQQRRHHSQVVR